MIEEFNLSQFITPSPDKTMPYNLITCSNYGSKVLAFVREHQDKIDRFLEVGVWCGYVVIQVAELLGPRKIVFGIDTFEGSSEHLHPSHVDDWGATVKIMYQQYLSNVQHHGLSNLYTLKMPSREAVLQIPDGYFDIVSIDGSHDIEDVVHDVTTWPKKIRSGGWLVGDDFVSVRVTAAFKQIGFCPDTVDGTDFWIKGV